MGTRLKTDIEKLEDQLKNQIEANLAYWKNSMRLNDWDIKLILMDNREMGRYGEAAINPPGMSAIITLQVPAPKHLTGQGDYEVTLVYELLHIRLKDFKSNRGRSTEEQEASIESLAQSLVANRRGKARINTFEEQA